MSLPTKPILLARLALRPSLFAPWTLLAAAVAQQAQRHASILSRISDNAGAYKKKIRRGRGPASGKGKTSGRGHKGQGQHGKGPPVGFQGGQTPEHIVKGPRGFENVYVWP
jgi:large subunit ribosomal protein L15